MKTKFIFITLFLGLLAINSFSQKTVWKTKAVLPEQIYSGSAVTCQEMIYFIGGQIDIGSGSYTPSKFVYEYNLEKDEWIKKTNMPTARFNMAICSVEDKIYVIGGDMFLKANEAYDPTTDTWQTRAHMPTARQHVKAAVVNNKIYIIGGLESWSEVSTKNEMYDPQTNTWEEMAPIPTSKHNYSTAVYNNKIYVFGGSTWDDYKKDVWLQTSSIEVYDPATNTWDTPFSLTATRFNPGIGLINNSIIIVAGSADKIVSNRVDIFDPVTGICSQSDPLPMKNIAMGSTTLNNKIYIIGGTGGSPSWVGYNTVYEGTFDESTGTDQFTNEDELLIFPNPATNYIQVQAIDHQYKSEKFQLLTIDGKMVKEGRLESEQINISDMNKGVYLLNIKTDEGIITKKIIIN